MTTPVVSLQGQKPTRLDPLNPILPPSGQIDPVTTLRTMVSEPILQPLNSHTQVQLTIDQHIVDEDELTDLILNSIGEVMDTDAQTTTNSLFKQALTRWNQDCTVPMDELFVTQAAAENKLPDPSKAIYSTATDVIPAAKDLLAGHTSDSILLASLGYTFHPHTVGYWFKTHQEFDEFKEFFREQVAAIYSMLTSETQAMLRQFNAISLKDALTESLILRAQDSQALEDNSFARLLPWALSNWVAHNTSSGGILPFSLAELLLPRTLVLINLEAHVRATHTEIAKEWRIIDRALQNPIKVVNPRQINKLTTLQRAQEEAERQAATSISNQQQNMSRRNQRVTFRKRPVRPLDITKAVAKVLKRMGAVNRSMNALRKAKPSFARANRRNPDDFNKPGKVISSQYMPDIHIYLDTSGSITEDNYRDTVTSLIIFAKKLNVDLYFTSFSHVISSPTKLRVKDRSVRQIWKQFASTPKVSGGTDFDMVWSYINSHPKTQRQLSLMITDFGYWPRSYRVTVPRNLYYVPISVPDDQYQDLRDWAMEFAANMKPLDPSTPARMLGIVQTK